jgi:hypothetical protein
MNAKRVSIVAGVGLQAFAAGGNPAMPRGSWLRAKPPHGWAIQHMVSMVLFLGE